jgi:hypothetical protein
MQRCTGGSPKQLAANILACAILLEFGTIVSQVQNVFIVLLVSVPASRLRLEILEVIVNLQFNVADLLI